MWVRLDDGFYRNSKQLRMSNAAFRLYVCALSFCAQEREPTGYLTEQQAESLRRAIRVGAKCAAELVELRAWEPVDGGYLIHDYDEYIERGSRERVRKHRDMKRHGNVTEALLARDGYPVPEPVPVNVPLESSNKNSQLKRPSLGELVDKARQEGG